MSANILPCSRADATDVVLTGDRPTGPLHLGHYAGSLRSRLALQGQCAQTLLDRRPSSAHRLERPRRARRAARVGGRA